MRDPVREAEIREAEESAATMFSGPKPEPAKRGLLVGTVAVAFVVLAMAGWMLARRSPAGHTAPNAPQPADPYAENLSFTGLAMSESSSLSGGKSTFMDGHVRNSGSKTLTAVTMQVFFKNDQGLSPSIETLPLAIIRTHEPYVDTEAVRAAPLKPGDEVEFRLIFETVPANWNQQMPDLRTVHVSIQ